MKAHHMDTHLVVPMSRSFTNVKVTLRKEKKKKPFSGAFVFHKHILFAYFICNYMHCLCKFKTVHCLCIFKTCIFNPFPNKLWFYVFTCLQYKSFENAVGKGEIAQLFQL